MMMSLVYKYWHDNFKFSSKKKRKENKRNKRLITKTKKQQKMCKQRFLIPLIQGGSQFGGQQFGGQQFSGLGNNYGYQGGYGYWND